MLELCAHFHGKIPWELCWSMYSTGIKHSEKNNLRQVFRRYHCVTKPKQASSPSGLAEEPGGSVFHTWLLIPLPLRLQISLSLQKNLQRKIGKTHQKRLSCFSLQFKNQTSSKMAKVTSAFVSVNSSFGADCFSLKCYMQVLPFQSRIGCHQSNKSSWMDQNKWFKV